MPALLTKPSQQMNLCAGLVASPVTGRFSFWTDTPHWFFRLISKTVTPNRLFVWICRLKNEMAVLFGGISVVDGVHSVIEETS